MEAYCNIYTSFSLIKHCLGALGDDLEVVIGKFKNGIRVKIAGDPVYPIWGLSNIIVGKVPFFKFIRYSSWKCR